MIRKNHLKKGIIMTRKEYWNWLLTIEKIGLKKVKGILDYYGSPEAAFLGKEKELRQIKILKEKDIINIILSKDLDRIKKNYDKLINKGIYLVTIDDIEYPSKLKSIYDPPYGLYVKGRLPKEEQITISIVGARNCSDYGKEVALKLSKELASCGIQVISGLANGIDGYAHRGALNAGAETYGILGCGIEICYPRENFSLYMDIQKQGGIISEYGLGKPPLAYQFPMRNRIISGLSDGILVIEAKEKSGSLITVDSGLEQGKNIYAVPGNIYNKLSEGCHNLIKMGAKIVTSSQDILEDFSYNYTSSIDNRHKNIKLLDKNEKIVYASLSYSPKHINDIAGETNLNIEDLSTILLQLELKSFIKEIRKNYYSCNSEN